ncbi:hypothetical protein TNCT_145121 [Trichonephila clavata]|uniref:Uncharacterized protein n=1 Tax=Trichonephila clavata TaxID=2740835 RepID=A0A8X6H2C5_TRICU|nr:hypothetical protein TNCT_145121 [Trichonephila clavata]
MVISRQSVPTRRYFPQSLRAALISADRQTDRQSRQSSGSGRTRAKLAQIPLLLHLLSPSQCRPPSGIDPGMGRGGVGSFGIPLTPAASISPRRPLADLLFPHLPAG